MNKIKNIILFPMIALALFPPMILSIPMVSERIWAWFILLSAFLALYTVFLDINIWIKIISIYLFVSCFFSMGIYYSFTAYLSYVLCLYYYMACLKISDWTFVKRVLLIILFLNGILLFTQFIHKDVFLNFGLKKNTCSGTVGNFMNLKSFAIIIIAFLISFLRITIADIKRWVWICMVFLIVGFTIYNVEHKTIFYFSGIRGAVWLKTIELTVYNGFTTLFGWGMSMFSMIFPQLTQDITNISPVTWWIGEGTWRQCHNDFLQILFETGFTGLTLVLCYVVSLFRRLIESKLYSLIIGLSLICADMMVHFPMRQTATVLIIIVFLAYCEYMIKKESLKWQI